MKSPAHTVLALVVAGALALVFVRRPIDRTERGVSPEEQKTFMVYEPVPDVVLLRSLAKELIALEVADGKRSLLDAAALFRELDRLPPESIDLSLLDGTDASLPIAGKTPGRAILPARLATVAHCLAPSASRAGPSGGTPDRGIPRGTNDARLDPAGGRTWPNETS